MSRAAVRWPRGLDMIDSPVVRNVRNIGLPLAKFAYNNWDAIKGAVGQVAGRAADYYSDSGRYPRGSKGNSAFRGNLVLRGTGRGRRLGRSNVRVRRIGRGRRSFRKKRKYRRTVKKLTFGDIFKKVKTNGVNILQEVGVGNYNTPYCLFMGHSTQPTYLMQLGFFQACVKKILAKRGLVAGDSQERILGLSSGDAIYIYYMDRLAQNTTLSFNYTFGVAATWTVNAAALGLMNAFNLINLENLDFTLIQFYANGSGDSADAFVDLRKADVYWYCKSDLKMQNITPGSASADQEADDVTAVHLTGKSYDFKNTCLMSRIRGGDATPAVTVSVDIQSTVGAGDMRYASTDANVREPPERNFWKECGAVKRLTCGPGELVRSHLQYAKKLSVSMFVKNILAFTRQNSPAQSFVPKSGYSVGRVFAFEKEIETVWDAGGSTPAINVAFNYEVDVEIGFDIVCKQVNSLCRTNFVGIAPAYV